jgi:hypothetical protein
VDFILPVRADGISQKMLSRARDAVNRIARGSARTYGIVFW